MKKYILILFMCIGITALQAQEKLITGKVTETGGIPLPGANVMVKGTTTAAQTDLDGIYGLKASEGQTLVFTYIGFKTKEAVVGKGNVINVELEEDASELDEVVVVGYGYQKRSDYTGSVTVVQSKAKAQAVAQQAYYDKMAGRLNANNNAAMALQGKVAGVQTNNATGNGAQIVIRGASTLKKDVEPLVVINGEVQPQGALQSIDPANIESINILKDASGAAIYGSKAANGVIVLTTKDGVAAIHQKKPLYIVDGQPIDAVNNIIIEKLPESEIDSKVTYNAENARRTFGDIAKNGCIVITTHSGNFRILDNESYAVVNENQFESVHANPLSTFSIDVDKAGYSNIRRMINSGIAVEPDAVKIEEMINYFDYDYPQPKNEHPFSITTNVAETPWNADTKLVRIGLKGKEYDTDELPASNLTFLIDVSGSMSDQNKLPLLKQAFKLLVSELRKQDKVAIVVYAGAAGMVLPPTHGDEKEKILAALDNLQAGGSTAGGAGINLAYSLATENFIKKGNNRVILATDGDFNVDVSSDKDMETLIEEKRTSGVYLSVLGFGMGNYKDSKLETLADKGNGNHAYIDNMQEAQKVFGKEFGGTLYTIAKDVKIQIEFNPEKVQAYRLIGYENRMLAAEDFVDDTKDAGELGAGHTVTAIYEVIPVGVESDYLKEVPQLKYTNSDAGNVYKDELFTVKFRYKKPDGENSIEMVHVQKDDVEEMPEDFSFAAAVALFGMHLKHSAFDNNAKTDLILLLAEKGKAQDKDGYRSEFIRLVKSSQSL